MTVFAKKSEESLETILQRKDDFTKKRLFCKEKIILQRKDDFTKKRWFYKEKMILQRKDDFAKKRLNWLKRVKEIIKYEWCQIQARS